MTDIVFLPGTIAPAEVRYRALLDRLPGVNPVLKDLHVYSSDEPPPGYSIQDEIDSIEKATNDAGLERFHLYGHSGGGACALAYGVAHRERVLSLAVDEPATDFTSADLSDPYYDEIDEAARLPQPESVAAFLRLQVAPGVALPPPPDGPPPPWMSQRPAGLRVFAEAIRRHHLEPAEYAEFDQPVLFTLGSLTHPRWRTMRDRLQRCFPNFAPEEFSGLHHLNTSHQAEPDRTAALLSDFWARATATGA